MSAATRRPRWIPARRSRWRSTWPRIRRSPRWRFAAVAWGRGDGGVGGRGANPALGGWVRGLVPGGGFPPVGAPPAAPPCLVSLWPEETASTVPPHLAAM